MNLRLLCSAPQADIYFDAHNDWLYIDWTGELTLPIVQTACAYVAHCFLARPYSRVLNNNTHVTSISWNVTPWLIRDFLPHLRLAGVQQLAWVCSPSLPGLSMVQTVLTWLPHLAIAVFNDLEDSAGWLQRGRAAGNEHSVQPAASQQQVALIVQDLTQQARLTQSPVLSNWF